jgi:ribonucleoside-diphosphate reductase alpha chain
MIYKYNRIGLGVMGFADLLLALNIPYDSKETLTIIDRIGRRMSRISHKIANNSVATLSIAPTGSLSIIANCSSGIEPIFSKSYTRNLSVGNLPESRSFPYLRTAHDISPEWHLKIQARWQKYIDNGVSKTVNLPHSASISDIQYIYLKAWKMDCKGITIYRDNSRSTQIYNKCSDGECIL